MRKSRRNGQRDFVHFGVDVVLAIATRCGNFSPIVLLGAELMGFNILALMHFKWKIAATLYLMLHLAYEDKRH